MVGAVDVVYMDRSKAFDNVLHGMLVRNLINMGFLVSCQIKYKTSSVREHKGWWWKGVSPTGMSMTSSDTQRSMVGCLKYKGFV